MSLRCVGPKRVLAFKPSPAVVPILAIIEAMRSVRLRRQLSVITVSLKTMRIVNALPALEID